MTNNKNPPDSPKTYQDTVMEEINHNYNGIVSNSQLIARAILSVTPIVITLVLIIDTAKINTVLLHWIIWLFVLAFITTAASFVISTVKLLKDNDRYAKELKKQAQNYNITSNKDKQYWTILALHCLSLLSFSIAIFLIPFSPNHQPKKEISMSDKNHKDKPQDNATPKKVDRNPSPPTDDRVERGGVMPRPIHIEPAPAESPEQETPEPTQPDPPPPKEDE